MGTSWAEPGDTTAPQLVWKQLTTGAALTSIFDTILTDVVEPVP